MWHTCIGGRERKPLTCRFNINFFCFLVLLCFSFLWWDVTDLISDIFIHFDISIITRGSIRYYHSCRVHECRVQLQVQLFCSRIIFYHLVKYSVGSPEGRNIKFSYAIAYCHCHCQAHFRQKTTLLGLESRTDHYFCAYPARSGRDRVICYHVMLERSAPKLQHYPFFLRYQLWLGTKGTP